MRRRTDPYRFSLTRYRKPLRAILGGLTADLAADKPVNLNDWLRRYPKDASGYFAKSELLKAYRAWAGRFTLGAFNPRLARLFTRKPRRTLSGVTPITVLTKPYPCPGKCIFCPSDIRMPKSYLSSEPGAQRAAANFFDPYLQTYNRLQALRDMGHPVDKAELIVLGGTWSLYPEAYQVWFVTRLFTALNDFGAGLDDRSDIPPSVSPLKPQVIASLLPGKSYNERVSHAYKDQELAKTKQQRELGTWAELTVQQKRNETALVRCVGLVLESRPDAISPAEVVRLRRLGATKTQIGIQSLNDHVLALNHRGHTVTATRRAFRLLRAAGFKIHAHWMPNLYGSSVTKDKADYRTLFSDPAFLPDELKIYPCSLIGGTGLVDIYKQGLWHPYRKQQLLSVLSYCLVLTPRFCRLTRIVRDIPSGDILVGNKLTNFRQLAQSAVVGQNIQEIRSREITNQVVNESAYKDTPYQTSVTTEHFLEYVTPDDRLVAFLRLSLPIKRLVDAPLFPELAHSALIREVHVYGQATEIGTAGASAQHRGLGKKLIRRAITIARQQGYPDLAVISAVGTREYYRRLGFSDGELYQHYAV